MVPERDERTEAPTAKRRSDARKEGNVARSTEINSVFVLLTGLILVRIFAQTIFEQLKRIFNYSYATIGHPSLEPASAVAMFKTILMMAGGIVLPIALGILAIGVAANLIQTGWILTLKPLQPKLEKIDPIKGFGRFFSMRSMVEAVKSIFKVAIVGLVAYVTVAGAFKDVITLGNTSVGAILVFILTTAFTIVFRVAIVLLVLAILDFMYQKWEYERNLKMTKQEIKDERKQLEGDPQVKRRIRSLQLEMARRRMMREVPRATVVVTNPTYIAIAIRYESETMDTPVVVAKGKRLVAERIREIAKEAGIPIVEDKPLARAMYDRVGIGDRIPVEFFTAVAEILAYVYRLKNRVAA
ncbi:MAG: flagellar biosynthesis protein FlhB [Chitinivibrionales bacterium]|nr:flagellar biosynthesis protein FlhB [Chitinivibrionales bacterium]MBD3394031.1 flagellar biosynthesis protein FlhB [Chitinivibrionales bacterium]